MKNGDDSVVRRIADIASPGEDGRRTKRQAGHDQETEPIAIIGMGCRFPGKADSPEAFWELIHNGRSAITEIPPDRWDADELYHPDPQVPGKIVTRCGGFIESPDLFDARFFNISPREASWLDPQQRIVLEVTWEALENAGIAPDSLRGSSTGVFMGISSMDYFMVMSEKCDHQAADPYLGTGNVLSGVSGRTSYVFGFTGPCMSIDTACSSALVALHSACESLRRRECDMAVSGAVNLIFSPLISWVFSKFGMLSPDGLCKTFDDAANGYGRGEGCGIVVLKRLSDALSAGNPVIALIRGSAVNQDGASGGLTVPNGPSQQRVIRNAHARAQVTAADIDYVEAHGTGTMLGDPIELEALGSVFQKSHTKDNPLLVGSVKTNIGHLEAASGIAGVIKVALALQHESIPALLNFQTPNSHVDWARLPIAVPTENRPWARRQRPRRAGISGFGFTGTNVHLVMEEAPPPRMRSVSRNRIRPSHVFTLSAKDENALKTLAEQHRLLPDVPVGDLCHSVNTTRAHMQHRISMTVRSADQLKERLTRFLAGEEVAGLYRGHCQTGDSPLTVFLFTGQGSQFVGMGRGLYESQKVFHDTMDQCAAILKHHDIDLLSFLSPDETETAAINLNMTVYTQPALFALEYSLAMLWQSWGISPNVMMGHSVGEYVAACLAGVFSLKDALKLISARGRLMQDLPATGAMAAVFAPHDRVQSAIAGYADMVSIAAFNAPDQVVLSGDAVSLKEIVQKLEAEAIRTKNLNVSHGFHSPLMTPMLDAFGRIAETVDYSLPQKTIISNITGEPVAEEIATPDYWVRHIRLPVQFHKSMLTLKERACEVFLEVGPQPVLLGMGRQCLPDSTALWLPSLAKTQEDLQRMMTSLCEMYVNGATVDWHAMDEAFCFDRIPLPNYPFQRQRFWFQEAEGGTGPAAMSFRSTPLSGHPLLGRRVHSAALGNDTFVFESVLRPSRPLFLKHHQIYETTVFPASGFLEIAAAAGMKLLAVEAVVLDAMEFHEALRLQPGKNRIIQITLEKERDRYGFKIYSLSPLYEKSTDEAIKPSDWLLHLTGTVASCLEEGDMAWHDVEQIRNRCPDTLPVEAFYERLRQRGLMYGEYFRAITTLQKGNGESLAAISLHPDMLKGMEAYYIHPALMDACFQSVAAACPDDERNDTYLPVGFDRIVLHKTGMSRCFCHARLNESKSSPEVIQSDLVLIGENGLPLATISGLRLMKITRRAVMHLLDKFRELSSWFYAPAWRPMPLIDFHDSSQTAGTWVILHDNDELCDAIVGQLESAGGKGIRVPLNSVEDIASQAIVPVAPDQRETLANALQYLKENTSSPCKGIVYLKEGSGSSAADDAAVPKTLADLEQSHLLGCRHLLDIVKACVLSRLDQIPRVVVMTRGAKPVGRSHGELRLQLSSLWGMAHVIAMEHPELHCTCIDLDPNINTDDRPGEVQSICRELLTSEVDNHVAFRQRNRFVERFSRLTDLSISSHQLGKTRPFQAGMTEPGILENLILAPLNRRPPGPEEVEIEVRATGLNFKDVLQALGMLNAPGAGPGSGNALSPPFGLECSGIVSAKGDHVADVNIGDKVFAAGFGCLANFVTVHKDFVIHTPAALSFEQAASVSTVFLTAYYALYVLAEIKPTDRILIHAGAGGVGQAAIQLARRVGAEVYTTASPPKWDYLKQQGIAHVMNSRTLDFADEVMAMTNGRGVDVVLNSLNGDYIPKNLSVLARGGRFVEIGKIGIWSEAQVAKVRPDIAYFSFDLSELTEPATGSFRKALNDITSWLRDGSLSPLPMTVFTLDHLVDGFRYLSQAKNIGKVVVTIPELKENGTTRPSLVQSDACYLITGGLGGVGLALAEWLVEKGATDIMLVARSAPTEAVDHRIQLLRKTGARILVKQADISDKDDVMRLLNRILSAPRPLRGIIHGAGMIEDAILLEQSEASFLRVMAPKVLGAWHLHNATREMPLDFFVCLSSISALLGTPGQGNYAAANAFMDTLMNHRNALGLPALSINWGPWDNVGITSRLSEKEREIILSRGVSYIKPHEGVEIFERLLAQDRPQVAAIPVNWPLFRQQFTSSNFPVYLDELLDAIESDEPRRHVIFEQLLEMPHYERKPFLLVYLRTQIARVMGFDSYKAIEPRAPLFDLGIDSLAAVELKNQLERDIGCMLRATMIIDYPTCEELVGHLVDDVLVFPSTPDDDNGTEKMHQGGEGLSGQKVCLDVRNVADFTRAATADKN